MHAKDLSAIGRIRRALVTVGLAVSLIAAGTSLSQAAGKSTSGLSPSSGPPNTALVLALTGSGFANDADTSLVRPAGDPTYGVSFSGGTCAVDADAGHTAGQIDATSATVASATRLVVTTPAVDGLTDAVAKGLETKKDWTLCVYASTPTNGTYKLLTSSKFTVYPAPTLSATNFISPASGPTSGSQTIVVIGNTAADSTSTASGYFSSKTTATVGGLALANVKVAKDGNSFTATTPPLPTGAADLVVTTEGGSVTAPAAYMAVNAITASPGRVAVGGGTVITVKGKGFSAIAAAAGFGVVLFSGTYDIPSNLGTPCTNTIVVSNTELICTSPAVPVGAYNVLVTDDITGASPTFSSVLSTGSTVTAAGF